MRERGRERRRETFCCAALDSHSSCIRESESADAQDNCVIAAVFWAESTKMFGVLPVYVMCSKRNSETDTVDQPK